MGTDFQWKIYRICIFLIVTIRVHSWTDLRIYIHSNWMHAPFMDMIRNGTNQSRIAPRNSLARTAMEIT